MLGVARAVVSLERVVVPVADDEDAVATAAALSPYLEEIRCVTVVHVIEKGSGAADKAPMEKRQRDARRFLSTLETRLEEEVVVETRIEFGTGVANTIVETAVETDADTIVYRPRGGSRLTRFLSGDTGLRLLTEAALPVVSITAGDDARQSAPRTRDDSMEAG
jgi:nucleotide-binding universal stress UspA family protein